MEDEFGHSFAAPRSYAPTTGLKGYWVITVRIIDQARYFAFLELAVDAIDRLGGRMIIRSPEVVVGCGSPKPRLVVVQFPSLEDAKVAFQDVAQQSAMLVYNKIAEYDVAIVEGYHDFG